GNKSLRQPGEFVSVRIPDLQRLRQVVKERTRTIADDQRAFAEFPFPAGLDLAAQKVGQDLNAVTDAEDRNAELENIFIRQRRVLGIDAGRTPRQDEAAGLERRDLLRRSVVAQEGGIHVALADATRDDLCV